MDRPIITDQAAHGLTNWLPAHQTDAFPVHPERWRQDRYRHLLRWRRLLDQLPTRLSNDDVLAMRQIGSAMQLFLWAMAWGFGGARQGYGAWRTDQMLAPPDAQQRVECLLALLADGKLSDAFSALHDPVRCRLPRLGTAFGTKLLYFGGFGLGTVPHEPLVLDAMVVRAFALAGFVDPGRHPDLRRRQCQHHVDGCVRAIPGRCPRSSGPAHPGYSGRCGRAVAVVGRRWRGDPWPLLISGIRRGSAGPGLRWPGSAVRRRWSSSPTMVRSTWWPAPLSQPLPTAVSPSCGGVGWA